MSESAALRGASRPASGAADAVFPTMVSSTFTLPGYEVESSLGIVRGIAVRARGLGPMLCAICQAVWWGGRISVLEHMCELARADACEAMMARARACGANAVIGVRYDACTLGLVSEVLAYGTAVVAVPSTSSAK